MATAAQLVAAGYPGYQGWSDVEANADFNATGGAGKGNGSPTGSGGGYNSVSAPNYAAIRDQISNILATQPTATNPDPYYYELAKQAKGDFNTAVSLMTSDYTTGVKQAKQTYAQEQKYGTADLQNSLSSLGITFNGENEKELNDLNQRGMAVYQNNPDGTPNVVTPGSFNPTYDTNNYTYNSGVSGPNPNAANLGRGGYEAEQLRQDQSLRAEAAMRAGMKPLEAAGITLNQTTNPSSNFNINDPKTYPTNAADLSKLGTAEQNAVRSYQTAVSGYNTKSADLANQRSTDINNLTQTYGNTQTGALSQDQQNQIQKQYNTDFVQSGLT